MWCVKSGVFSGGVSTLCEGFKMDDMELSRFDLVVLGVATVVLLMTWFWSTLSDAIARIFSLLACRDPSTTEKDLFRVVPCESREEVSDWVDPG